MNQLQEIECRTFQEPDDRLDFKEHGQIDILKLYDGTAGLRATLKPGWKWEVDEKPLLGNPQSCPLPHVGYCTSGELVVRMVDTAKETRIRQGDFFEIPPGHDAYVPGDRTCELIMFMSPEEAARHLP